MSGGPWEDGHMRKFGIFKNGVGRLFGERVIRGSTVLIMME